MTSMSPEDVRIDVQDSALSITDAIIPSMSDIKSRAKQAKLSLRTSVQDLKKRKEPSYKGDNGRSGSHLSPPSVFPIVNRPHDLQKANVSTSGFGIRAFLRRLTGGQPSPQITKTASPTQQVGDRTPIGGEKEKDVLKELPEELRSDIRDDQIKLDPCNIPLPPSPTTTPSSLPEELSPEIRDDQIKLDPCNIPLPPSPTITFSSLPEELSPEIRDDQIKLDPCSIPLPPSPTITLSSLPAISSSAEPQEEEQIRPRSESAKPEENRSPDQHFSVCLPAANDLLACQTSGSDGRSHQPPPMLSISPLTIQETCPSPDTSPTVSPVEDEIIVSPVSFQDSESGLMMDWADSQERVDLDGEVQQPAYSRSRSASPAFQKAEFGLSGEKRGNNKSWRRSMRNLSEALNRRSSFKPPPTSYDAYMTHQRRMADRRQGCAPTVYRTGAQAVLEAINNLEEEDEMMAEKFFMS
ncbi:hypothetical protein CNK01935 [Cryptococcus deneoformans JEC21]|uniref:Uncharacterized protein n=1 Tax=Cryptococcus deneoformans (strain JEC21 / ATCC MYA-565) TaxID=214684 RepID=A0A0S2M613_CRYD1|nr:hypothetical protein CNK01935 [Cryptococcus neoformans var. neoformans JEC21]ALO69607.1 hypothetical protein CNK01935 [Cryptococcus neoformans var. neoformans JEC21]